MGPFSTYKPENADEDMLRNLFAEQEIDWDESFSDEQEIYSFNCAAVEISREIQKFKFSITNCREESIIEARKEAVSLLISSIKLMKLLGLDADDAYVACLAINQ